MIDIQTIIDSKSVGETFVVGPKDLEMTADEFDRLAVEWILLDGGQRFRLAEFLRPHKESESGFRYYDRIGLIRVED